MEQFPEAALGISQEVAEDNQPYPFIMSPRETYRREFLKRGVLGMGPTGTIIRREVFEELGGFSGTRYIGDTEMWYKNCRKIPGCKAPGLVYWRARKPGILKCSNIYLKTVLNYKNTQISRTSP